MTTRTRPERTPNFRIQHPVSEMEYVVYLMRPRAGSGTVHIVFDSTSPHAPGVRRIVHSKRRGYSDFLEAAYALLGMTRWHHPAPYLRTPRGLPKVRNPDHYAVWDTEHHAWSQHGQHQTTISLFVDQLADPVRGRGITLTNTIAAARTAHDERKVGGAVTAVTRARMNLRAGMLRDVARALSIVGPYHAQFLPKRERKRGPTALGYTHDEADALGRMWTRAYQELEAVQNAVRHNELYAAPTGPDGTPLRTPPVILHAAPNLTVPDIDGTGLVPKGFSFTLDDES